MSIENLDEFLNTTDEYFNHIAQYWNFEFNGPNKPLTEKPFKIIISALKEIYFFSIENYNKPFACIENIESTCSKYSFSKNDKLLVVDKLLSMLFHLNQNQYFKAYIQILDYRNDIEPLNVDTSFITNNFRFDFENIKKELDKHHEIEEKIKFLTRTMFDFDLALPTMDELEYEYYESTKLVQLVNVEFKRLQYELSISKNTKDFKAENIIKPFEDYLLHENKLALAQKLKSEFGNEQNKEIRFMLEALKFHDPPLIAFTNQTELIRSMDSFFGKSVGTRQAIFGSKNLDAYKPEIEAFKVRLEFVLNTITK